MNPAPPAGPALPSHEAMEQAAAWFTLLRSGAATEADQTRWRAWLAGTEDSRAAWAFVERVSQRFQPLQTGASPRLAADALQRAGSHLARRRIVLGAAAMAGGAGVLGWSVWRQSGARDTVMAWRADFRSATGERREVRLADGTEVWLGSASAFDQDYGTGLRRLRLRAGEILIRTATDSGRPFVVDTAQGRMRALGTRFNVRLDGRGRTELAVYEGTVEVTLIGTVTGAAANPVAASASVTVSAGQQLAFTTDQLGTLAPADPAREAWSRGVLLAQDLPLAHVIAELSRYRHGRIAVAPEVARLPVLGSFPLDDVDGALSMLAQTLPIRIRRPLPWWTAIEAGTP